MPSVVHGPGTKEGSEAELPPRPSSLWDTVAERLSEMDDLQKRRVAMLMLHASCHWTLEAVGKVFGRNKGHVCREITRAAGELHDLMRDDYPGLVMEARESGPSRRISVRIPAGEFAVLQESAQQGAVGLSALVRHWLLQGGLREAVSGRAIAPDYEI